MTHKLNGYFDKLLWENVKYTWNFEKNITISIIFLNIIFSIAYWNNIKYIKN
jgi:hypothetical protein